MAPTKIGRYDIKGELGRGGMATVYRAYDPSFEREVAIKVLPRELMHDPQFRDRFRREIKTIASLEHPAIVPVYDVGEEDGMPYFVMRYMTGGSLTQWIDKGKFSLEDAARIIERLSGALAYAHKNGLVHRDLKPDNILFDNNGDPFISDFGVAKITNSTTNMTGSGIIGTPAYMSPEQAQGEPVDNRSDIYGLGVIIFQMLSGHQPYEATTPMGVAVKHITDPVPEILKVNPGLPQQTDTIIKTAMAKDPSLRYQTATELAHALSEAAFGKGKTSAGAPPSGHVSPQAPTRIAAAPSGGGSRMGMYIAGGIVLLLLLAAAGVFGSRAVGPAPTPTSTATQVPPTATAIVITATLPADVRRGTHLRVRARLRSRSGPATRQANDRQAELVLQSRLFDHTIHGADWGDLCPGGVRLRLRSVRAARRSAVDCLPRQEPDDVPFASVRTAADSIEQRGCGGLPDWHGLRLRSPVLRAGKTCRCRLSTSSPWIWARCQ